MSQLSPSKVLAEVTGAVPAACRENIVIIGSLAAGYQFFGDDPSKAVRTKDIDCVLEPFHAAVGAGQSIARQLLDAGWQRRLLGENQQPGTNDTPTDQLPAVRLYPPGSDPAGEDSWFIELLTVPESASVSGRAWTRLPLAEGHFGLPTFRFLSITAFDPLWAGDLGIRHARAEMMALANLLEHPQIKPERMSGAFAGKMIKRSNKDLGRVLAIALLSALYDFRPWSASWGHALQSCFPSEWRELSRQAGTGLRALLKSESDLDEARHTCANGLLATQPPTLDTLSLVGERLLIEAIEPLEAAAL
ncbi:MAG: hypothetical protein IPK22_17225 [Verrucomicrobiaceae bacterium]|nr:hypothetical protein [Verrucomicrobiaceae bacterium]